MISNSFDSIVLQWEVLVTSLPRSDLRHYRPQWPRLMFKYMTAHTRGWLNEHHLSGRVAKGTSPLFPWTELMIDGVSLICVWSSDLKTKGNIFGEDFPLHSHSGAVIRVGCAALGCLPACSLGVKAFKVQSIPAEMCLPAKTRRKMGHSKSMLDLRAITSQK